MSFSLITWNGYLREKKHERTAIFSCFFVSILWPQFVICFVFFSVQRSISSIGVVHHWKKKSDNWAKLRNIVVHEQNHAQPKRFFPEWNTVFIVSCVLAVSLDPLFLYIPIVNEDRKCLKYDKRLKAISFGLRLLADLFYMADVVYRILTRPKVKEAVTLKASNNSVNSRRTLQFYILLDILAVLPVPQVSLKVLYEVDWFPNFSICRSWLL